MGDRQRQDRGERKSNSQDMMSDIRITSLSLACGYKWRVYTLQLHPTIILCSRYTGMPVKLWELTYLGKSR